MESRHVFKNKDLVLQVNLNYDPTKLRLDEWSDFLDRLCGDRDYQREAIETAIIYLASGRYSRIEDLVEENYSKSSELQERFYSLAEYNKSLQIPGKIFANLDLATATGKSYVIYGIAQIMLGLGLVDKVLVLCPSLTIESELKNKFEKLSGNSSLKAVIPSGSYIENPRVIDANSTIKKGDICVENIHAIYDRTGSSINDSLIGNGLSTLVLNDESHHIYNKTSDTDIKKWKEFLCDDKFGFKYMLGFTGTAYVENEYFSDVIFRYSLRQAIEEKFVKSIYYVQKDDTSGSVEKLQKIYQNHEDNRSKYNLIKPLTILITRDIDAAKALWVQIVDFLVSQENIARDTIEAKVLIVTSHRDHKNNVIRLKNVDDNSDDVEWIISVSMLTEGWDVKNVFQIVPWEDRAFNSKLLIAQVLGRGLRVPQEYLSVQPKVIVFNHDSWSKNIIELVNEILEIETRAVSEVLTSGDRYQYHFGVYNLNYDREDTETDHERKQEIFNFSRISREGIKLESQVTETDKDTTFDSIIGGSSRNYSKSYSIKYETWSVDEIVDSIIDQFINLDWEGRVLQLGEDKYTQNNLPSHNVIAEIIYKSMRNVGINGDRLVEKNRNKILTSFGTLLRRKGKTVTSKLVVNEPYIVYTTDIQKDSLGISNLKKDSSLFYSSSYERELSPEQIQIINDIKEEEETFPISALKQQSDYSFKTPLSIFFTKGKPERKFVEELCKKSVYERICCWIKSRDRAFYNIEYSWKKNNHTQKISMFNPDFFIKVSTSDGTIILVVEVKDDGDNSDENRAKYKSAVDHFNRINNILMAKNIREKYVFHFLSPNGYSEYFEYLKNGILFESQERFRCELENLLEDSTM